VNSNPESIDNISAKNGLIAGGLHPNVNQLQLNGPMGARAGAMQGHLARGPAQGHHMAMGPRLQNIPMGVGQYGFNAQGVLSPQQRTIPANMQQQLQAQRFAVPGAIGK